MSDIDFNVLIGVNVLGIAFLREDFPLARERGFSYVVDKRVTTFVCMGWQMMVGKVKVGCGW